MTDSKRSSGTAIVVFALMYLILDSLVAMLLLLGRFSVFRSIFYIYWSNFVVFPAFGLIYFFFTVIRRNINWASLVICSISITLFGVYVYATHIEPRSLKIVEIEIHTDKIKTDLVIAHISDIQTTSVGAYEQKVFEKLGQLNPDIIFHTGDLIQLHNAEDYQEQLHRIAELFKRLKPRYGVFNVMGNVDHQLMAEGFDRMSGVRTLINRNKEIVGDGFKLDVLGLSCAQSMRGDKATIVKWLENSRDSFTIILGHAPDYLLDIMDVDIDLCLAGHTHGGQVNLPFVGPLLNASNTPKSWANGFRRFDHTALNVSSGIGTERANGLPAIRFNCPPTISIIRITGRQKEAKQTGE